MSRPLADWAYKKGYRKVVTVSQDYAFGHEQCGGAIAQRLREGRDDLVDREVHGQITSAGGR